MRSRCLPSPRYVVFGCFGGLRSVGASTLLSRFPFAAAVVGKSRDAALVEVDHVHDALDFADHFGGAHVGQGLGQKFTAGFGLSLVGDFPVPLDDLEVFGENLAEELIEGDLVVAGFSDGFHDVLRIDPEVHAKEAVEAAAEVLLVGLGQLVGDVFAYLRKEAGQMQEPAGMRFVGRGQVEANFAGRPEVGVCHVGSVCDDLKEQGGERERRSGFGTPPNFLGVNRLRLFRRSSNLT